MKTTTLKTRIFLDNMPRAVLGAIVFDVLALLAQVHDEESDRLVMDDEKECGSGADFHEMTGRILEEHGISLAAIDAFTPPPADPYVPIAAALRALGHASPIVIVSAAERAAAEMARAESEGTAPAPLAELNAAIFGEWLPAVWEHAKRGHAGGGTSTEGAQ